MFNSNSSVVYYYIKSIMFSIYSVRFCVLFCMLYWFGRAVAVCCAVLCCCCCTFAFQARSFAICNVLSHNNMRERKTGGGGGRWGNVWYCANTSF